MFVSDIEFWSRTPGWSASLMVVTPDEKWTYLVGESRTALAFSKLAAPTSTTGVFLSVHPITRACVADRLELKGFLTKNMHWVQ